MKKIAYVFILIYSAFMLSGCVAFWKPSRSSGSALKHTPAYSGAKASIEVIDFEVKSAKATNEIARGLREMLITELLESNRFLIVSRASGQKADILISITLSEFETQVSGGRSGVGGGGSSSSGLLGGLLGTSLNKAHLSLDIRIVKATSFGDLLAATRLKGQANDSQSAIAYDFSDDVNLNKDLAVYMHTPMEKAIRLCIFEAMRYITYNIPQYYYKYD